MNQDTLKQLGALVTKVSVTYSRKVSTGDFGSEGAVFGVEADTPAGADIDAVGDALYAWAKTVATRNLAPDLRAKTEARFSFGPVTEEMLADSVTPPGAFGPPEPQAPAKEESEEGHTRIARFTLNHAGDAKDDKFKLELYPRIGDKPGKWPELKFTGTREAVWGFIGPEWDNDWKLPCDKTVDWLADWKLGREKTGEKAKPGSRYKDLIAIHGA